MASVGSLGHGAIYTFENDTGPDEANHAEQGIFIMNNAPGQQTGPKEGLHLWDVHSTILDIFGLEPAPGALGTSALQEVVSRRTTKEKHEASEQRTRRGDLVHRAVGLGQDDDRSHGRAEARSTPTCRSRSSTVTSCARTCRRVSVSRRRTATRTSAASRSWLTCCSATVCS